MRVTIADVARRARVSKATVSRVLNNRGEVDAGTAVRVREVIAATGYTPSAGAVGLARGRTQTVGVLVPHLTCPWMGDVLQGVSDVLEAHGYGLLLHTMNRGADSVTRFTRHVSGNAFDGLLLVEPPDPLSCLTGLRESGFPVVVVDDGDDGDGDGDGDHPGFPSVATSNRAGATAAATHLLATGRTRPVVIPGPAALGRTRARTEGFRTPFTAAGHPTPHHVEADPTRAGGRTAITALLAENHEFDSVFTHNDLTAAGVLDALHEAHVDVPTQVAVIGFDDIDLAAHTQPPLTTVRRPSREMGEAAATILLANLAGAPFPTTPEIIPTELIVRASAP
ncbi:LacI family DNA-binding transcriptional regulator [Actinokineospora spheciospongiae]|nr:LacI family DNA-binding transcriptional regulator [Actinokineospora spheciospongiae]